jgi:hypothetical protein
MVLASCCYDIKMKGSFFGEVETVWHETLYGCLSILYFNACDWGKKLLPIFCCDFGLGGGGSCLDRGFVQLQGNKNCISGTAQASIIRTMFGVVVN